MKRWRYGAEPSKLAPPPPRKVRWLLWVNGDTRPMIVRAQTADRAKRVSERYFQTHSSNIRCAQLKEK